MFADHLALGVFDRTGGGAEVPAQELLERPLTDKTDAGAVRLVEYRQPGGMGAPANFVFAQRAERKEGAGERGPRHAVQEIALILGAVGRLQQLRAVGRVPQPGVVAGGDPRRAQAVRVVEADPKLDFAIAQHVRIRGAARRVFAQEMREDTFAVLGGKTHSMQRYA